MPALIAIGSPCTTWHVGPPRRTVDWSCTSSMISEPTWSSSGIASHWVNLRESPPTTSQHASAAYDRHDLPPRSTISRIGRTSVSTICAESTPSM